MPDPFKDFAQVGYLRNLYGEKDPQIVQELEHQFFRANLDDAIAYLAAHRALRNNDFLQVCRSADASPLVFGVLSVGWPGPRHRAPA